ncbi:Add66p [Sugiyamaella lignohabitans]|uniref:Proteasome assembly chaperone 2 n=1 Tax=Sugiyamaella lignohabitans TaxID=796027 RepID=A0A167ENR0_9ASCO|nr:Add66p [Sugiyamaella lignohabitans]ANB14291.1 Add66p [Sugiyamaella lignohabitans]
MVSSGSNILVIPAVSAGNIPQLTLDLLIHNLDCEFVESLDDRYLYPFAGPRDGPVGIKAEPGLTTPIEAYRSKKHTGLTLLQVRSPTLPGCKAKFVSETLVPYVEKGQYTDVVVLGSSNAAFEHSGNPFDSGAVVGTSRLRVYTTDQAKGDLSERLAALTLSGTPKEKQQLPGPPETLPESGIVLDALNGVKTVPVSAIVTFAYEGDNSGDALWLAGEVTKMLNIEPPATWRQPRSWQGIYGREIPVGIEEGLYS